MTILRTLASVTLAAASLSTVVGCSGDSHQAAQQAATVSSSSSSPSPSSSPTTSSSTSSTTSAATTTTPAPVTSSSTRTTRTVTPTTAARPRTTTPAKSYTCHYEEGTAPCTYAEYLENKEAYASYEAGNNGGAGGSSSAAPATGLDANGFALGGPPYPAAPSDFEQPSSADCSRFARQLHAWADYQNAHRPAGYNGLPSSGDIQYLGMACHISYYG